LQSKDHENLSHSSRTNANSHDRVSAGGVYGSHYKDMKIQPAEYTHANGIGHLAGDAIAYISRYKSKNGRKDLEKAVHSLQLLIQLEYGE
jgi:hypothetical protein